LHKDSQMSIETKRKHNKSNKEYLSLVYQSQQTIQAWLGALEDRLQGADRIEMLCTGSPCIILKNKKGTLVIGSKHVCYGYQLVAYEKFGALVLEQVRASKEAGDLLISHTCGTRNCCNGDHMLLEPKWVNDERTHCHFVLGAAKKTKGWDGFKTVQETGCPHTPKCGSVVVNKIIKTDDAFQH
jgi:hypothetical protein